MSAGEARACSGAGARRQPAGRPARGRRMQLLFPIDSVMSSCLIDFLGLLRLEGRFFPGSGMLRKCLNAK